MVRGPGVCTGAHSEDAIATMSRRSSGSRSWLRWLILVGLGVPAVAALAVAGRRQAGQQVDSEAQAIAPVIARPAQQAQQTQEDRVTTNVPPPASRPSSGEPLAFDVAIEPNGSLKVYHDHTPVLTAAYLFWGPNWKWAGSQIAVHYAEEGPLLLKGTIESLGITISGFVMPEAPNVFEAHYTFDAAEALSGIIGGGIEWRPLSPLPTVPGATGQPEILPGNRGWRWEPVAGNPIEVTFEPSVANVYFERGDPRRIRTMLIGEQVKAGRNTVVMRVTFPEGSRRVPSATERYGPARTFDWIADAHPWNLSPVDLRHLNDMPAGARGFVRPEGDRLVFEDNTPARFWGGNLAAGALFRPNEEIEAQAVRIAKLGYNLMRIHHHDSLGWVKPCVIDLEREDTRHLDEAMLERIDYWIKCLKEQGVYVWLDLHVGRLLKAGDEKTDLGVIEGFSEILGPGRNGEIKGFCYYNDTVRDLMREFNKKYLGHVNRHTGIAYKDDPAIIGILLTNENDITHHFGNLMLPDKNNPVHNRMFQKTVDAFCAKTGLDPATTWQTWLAGPSKILLNNQEYLFNTAMMADLREMGVRAPVATTNSWGFMGFCSLPALSRGGLIDVHSYGEPEALNANPRYEANYIAWIGANHVADMPLTITEWNVPYDYADRFTAPMYVSAIACLQGWDAPMIYNYSQRAFGQPANPDPWSTFCDPGLTAVMPSAALAFREQHVSEAQRTYCLQLTREDTYFSGLGAATSQTVRTLVEQSRITIGLPDIPELDWDRATAPGPSATIVTDANEDFIAPTQTRVASDTGEIARDWAGGVQTIDTPRTQAVSGWIGGEELTLSGLRVAATTPKAFVAATSLDNRPIAESESVLITAVARVVAPNGRTPFLAEPVTGDIQLTAREGMRIRPLNPDGERRNPLPAEYAGGTYRFKLAPPECSLWYIVEP